MGSIDRKVDGGSLGERRATGKILVQSVVFFVGLRRGIRMDWSLEKRSKHAAEPRCPQVMEHATSRL